MRHVRSWGRTPLGQKTVSTGGSRRDSNLSRGTGLQQLSPASSPASSPDFLSLYPSTSENSSLTFPGRAGLRAGEGLSCFHPQPPDSWVSPWLRGGEEARWMSVLWSHSQCSPCPTPSTSTLPFPLPLDLPLDFLSYSCKVSQSSISELKSFLNHLLCCLKAYSLIVEWLHSGGQGENWEYGKGRRVWGVD